MSLADELEKLQNLREEGALTEDEFQVAKTKLLNAPAAPTGSVHNWTGNQLNDFVDQDNSLGTAANRYVSFQMIMGIIGFILFVFFSLFMLSQMGHMGLMR